MITDFFTATQAEVQSLDIAKGPSQCLRAKRTDPVKLVQLQCCIDGVPFEQRLPLLDQMLVRDGGEDGPWIYRLPEVLQGRLAAASAADVERFGRAWAATDEWKRDGGTPDLIVPFLAEIARLAAKAAAQQRAVFVWMCL